MNITHYPAYTKKKWKINKGRFVNTNGATDRFILPIDDTDIQLLEYMIKIKSIVKKEYEQLYEFNFYNATFK